MGKHILIVASTFPASDTDPVPAFVKDQAKAFKQQYPQLRISVLAPHDDRSKTKDIIKHQHYDEYRFHYFWPYRFEKLAGRGILPTLKQNKLYYLLVPFLFFGEFIALLRLVKKTNPDIIYAHWFTPQAVIANWVSRLTSTPFVFTTHASDVAVWKSIPLLGQQIVKSTTRNARAFSAVSTQTMAKLQQFFDTEEWGKIKSKAAIIPMGINEEAFKNTSKTSAQLKDAYDLKNKKVILFIGRLAEKKGVTYLLQAFAQLDRLDTALIIAGDGPLLQPLKKETNQLGIDNSVRFAGYISGATKQNYLQLADVLVVPSIITQEGDQEGLPVALIEGLAAGKICIATHQSGARDLIKQEENGYLIDHKDSASLADALRLSLDDTSKQNQQIKKQAIVTSKQLSWVSIAKKHFEHLLRSTNEPSR